MGASAACKKGVKEDTEIDAGGLRVSQRGRGGGGIDECSRSCHLPSTCVNKMPSTTNKSAKTSSAKQDGYGYLIFIL